MRDRGDGPESRKASRGKRTAHRRGIVGVPANESWTLQSSRLLLNPMVQGDAGELFTLLREPALHGFTGNAPPASAVDLQEKIRRWESRQSPTRDELWLNWTLRLKSSGIAVGFIQATYSERTVDLAWVIGVPFQGRGYAIEASCRVAAWFRDAYDLADLRASIHPDHIASQRVAMHLGLQPSGEFTDEGEELWVARC